MCSYFSSFKNEWKCVVSENEPFRWWGCGWLVWRETPPFVCSLCLLYPGCSSWLVWLACSVNTDWTTQSSEFCSQMLLQRYWTSLHTSSEDEGTRVQDLRTERIYRPPLWRTSAQSSRIRLNFRSRAGGEKRRKRRRRRNCDLKMTVAVNASSLFKHDGRWSDVWTKIWKYHQQPPLDLI